MTWIRVQHTGRPPLEEGEVQAHLAIGDAPTAAAILVPPVDPEDGDADEDGVLDSVDNCAEVPNADQADSDGDGICPEVANKEQVDSDENGVGDACEPE